MATSAGAAASSATSSAKERHYAHLAAQLQTLSNNVAVAQQHLAAAASQTQYIRSLGAGQAALFMAALHQVDHESMGADENEETAHAQRHDVVSS